jgi:hypothetical protein
MATSQLLRPSCVSGVRAFTGIGPKQMLSAVPRSASHIVRVRKDSFMVEVSVAEEETEDIAVRRYMKAVMDSKVLEALRARKTRESKIEAYKRRMRERHEIRKLGIVEQTWEEVRTMLQYNNGHIL